MSYYRNKIPTWMLIISGIIALIEIGVSFVLWLQPQTFADKVEVTAKGVTYLFQMWAVRQLALGLVFAYGTLKKSIPILQTAYLFLLIMFLGEALIAFGQKDMMMAAISVVLALLGAFMFWRIGRRR